MSVLPTYPRNAMIEGANMAQTEKRVAGTRTKKRSRSGAHTPCPHCNKQLRGAKGLEAHIANEHAEGK